MVVKGKKQAMPKAPKVDAPAVRKARDIPTPAMSPIPPKRKLENAFPGDDFPVGLAGYLATKAGPVFFRGLGAHAAFPVTHLVALTPHLTQDTAGMGMPRHVLDAVVKIYCTHCDPNHSLPWQMRRQAC
jgi:hypothetical protein